MCRIQEVQSPATTAGGKASGNGSQIPRQQQLPEKESLLTETRLEALSSAHQLESLRETVNRMRNEMMALKSDNEKLAEDAVRRSLHSSRSSLNQITDAAGEELTERNQIP